MFFLLLFFKAVFLIVFCVFFLFPFRSLSNVRYMPGVCHNKSASPVSLKAQAEWFSRMEPGEVAIRSVASVVAYFVDEGSKAFPIHVAVAAVEHGLQRKLTDAEEWFSSSSSLHFRFDLNIFYSIQYRISPLSEFPSSLGCCHLISLQFSHEIRFGVGPNLFPWCGWKIGHSH